MTNETKKTVVELIFQEMLEIQQSGKTLTFDENLLLLEKYKEMEKEQIINSFWNGDNTDCTSEQNIEEFAEQYYNETFGGGEL